MNKELFTWEDNTLRPTPYFETIVKSHLFDDKFLTRLSIKKWQRIVLYRIKNGSKVCISEQGYETCALCHQYFFAYNCAGCPISWITKQDCCDGTPYRDNPSLFRALAELLFLYFIYLTIWVRIGKMKWMK